MDLDHQQTLRLYRGLGSNQTLAHETWTKLHMSSEIFDAEVDSVAYDPSNDKFTVPTGKGGYYNIGFKVTGENRLLTSRQYIIWTKMNI